MSERYGGNRPPRNYNDRPRSSGQRPAGAGYNTNSAHRSTAGRPASRPAQGTRPVSRPPQNARPGSRPPQNGRRPAPKRKKKSAAPTIILIIVIIAVIIFGIIFGKKLFGNNNQDISNTNQGTVTTVTEQPASVEATAVPADQASLADSLNDEDAVIQGLTKDQMVDVTSLSINENLPEEWMNILLLGTDERNPNESSRSDTMIICSVNENTGEVKLTSIMRDLAVEFNDLGKNSGTYRINSANYFGGPEYAMKTVNECFDMNIQHYVSINFFGFQDIAHALGGITVDITQEEMVEINRYVWNAHVAAEKSGIDDSNIPLNELFEYGEGTQLDGRQTLSYARIRKLDNDYARANRQRETLGKLADKLKQKSPAEITLLMASFTKYIKTNMDFEKAASIAMKVLQGDMSNIEGFRLPVERTYEAKTVNEKSMLYDCDWAANARDLYTFIYS